MVKNTHHRMMYKSHHRMVKKTRYRMGRRANKKILVIENVIDEYTKTGTCT